MPNKKHAKAATAEKHHEKAEKVEKAPKHAKAEKTPKAEKPPKAEKHAKPEKHAKDAAPAEDVITDMPPSPVEGKKHRRTSSSVTDVLKPEELAAFLGDDKDLVISKDVSKLNWKMNTSPGTLDEAKHLKEVPISTPKIRKLHVFFSTGIHVTARASPSSKVGVSVYDVLTAIHKLYKKKADDELELPVLANIEWGRGDDLKAASTDWPAVALAVQKKESAPTGKKGKK